MTKRNKTKVVRVPGRMVSLSLKQQPTKYIQLKSGLMKGRKLAAKGMGDGTYVMRLEKDVDVNKDGKIGTGDLRKGQVVGRTSKRTKARFVEIKRHKRKTKKGKRTVRNHQRKIQGR